MMVGLFDKIYYATYDCPNKHANLVWIQKQASRKITQRYNDTETSNVNCVAQSGRPVDDVQKTNTKEAQKINTNGKNIF